MCPGQIQASKEVNDSQAFLPKEEKKRIHFFSGRVASRCSKACLYKISRIYSKNGLRRTANKSNLTPEIDYILKPSNEDAEP